MSAPRHEKVRALADDGALQLSLFDHYSLAEQRRAKREGLLTATETALDKIRAEVARRTKTPLTAAQIGQKVGRAIHRHKRAKHFETTIADSRFDYRRLQERIAEEAALDGIYVIRTSEPAERLSAAGYKNLARVERVFAALKGLDLRIRPIYHRGEDRVRAHLHLPAGLLHGVAHARRCCSMTRNCPKPAPGAIRWHLPSHLRRRAEIKPGASATTGCQSTASIP